MKLIDVAAVPLAVQAVETLKALRRGLALFSRDKALLAAAHRRGVVVAL